MADHKAYLMSHLVDRHLLTVIRPPALQPEASKPEASTTEATTIVFIDLVHHARIPGLRRLAWYSPARALGVRRKPARSGC